MNFAGFVEHHARSIVAVALLLALAGAVAVFDLPVGLFPEVSFPRVSVSLDAGDRPADETALELTAPVERAVRAVPGVRNVQSETGRGSAELSIDFGWGRDMVAETLLVDQAIAQISGNLPAGATYIVRRMDPTVYPFMSYALSSDHESLIGLRDLATLKIVPLLSGITGLAKVEVQGGENEEIEVTVDPRRLAALGLGLNDVVSAIGNANRLQAVGRVEDRDRLYLALADNSIHASAEVAAIVLKGDRGGVVRLGAVADVRTGSAPQYIGIGEDGKPAVLLNLYIQPEANVVEIAKEVRAKLAGFALPRDVRLVNWWDQSVLVNGSASAVRDAVGLGLVLAGLVLFAFLRQGRVTLVPLLVVPMVLAIAVLVLDLLGMSFNIMTLGGIAASVGLIIDDVIVMIEHIARRTAKGALVFPAAHEFLKPLTFSSLATLIVFVPLIFLDGITGAFAKALAITMGAALLVSYLLAAILVPILVRFGVQFKPHQEKDSWLERGHHALLSQVMRRPVWLALAAAVIIAVGVTAYMKVPTGFMPVVDEGGFVMDFYTKPGTSLAETNREEAQIDAILHAEPDILTFSRRTGGSLSGDLVEPNHGDIFALLKTPHRLSTQALMDKVMDEIQTQVPGVDLEFAQRMEDLIGDLTAVPEPIEIKLSGAENQNLIAAANKVADSIGKVAGVTEIENGVVIAGDGVRIHVDAAKAAIEGMSVADVTQEVDASLEGTIATTLPRTDKTVGVRVKVAGARTQRLDTLGGIAIRAPDGHLFPLSRVASLEVVTGQPELTRENLEPMVAVTARIEGRGYSATVADLRKTLDAPGYLPNGMRYELGGLYQQQQIAFAGLVRVFLAALAAELVLLLFLYERFWWPVLIMSVSLLSSAGVFLALWITGVDLNITALIGLTMILGIGTEMAIFLVSEFQALAESMDFEEALAEASRNRLRPITMTTLAALLTLMPLAFAIGQGAGMLQPLAIAIIAGLLLQYPLVLLGLPVMLRLVERGRNNVL